MTQTLKELLKEINDWQDEIFTRATPQSAANHLLREAVELVKNPTDPMEMADVFLLIAAVAHLAGADLVQAVETKLWINRQRDWGEPDSEGVVEHKRAVKNFLEKTYGRE